jgi:S-adenosylmethionine:tRNA ribosyltransferase-isomerase
MPDLDLIEHYDYALPDSAIALHPAVPRSSSRLLVIDPREGSLLDSHMVALPSQLRAGDLLVFNETRVIPSRLRLRRQTGAQLESLVIGFGREGCWDPAVGEALCLLRGAASVRLGEALLLDDSSTATLVARAEHGAVSLRFERPAFELFAELGLPPLPPYIRAGRRAGGERETNDDDRIDYQTTFAADDGAVAAPTAGLHFDEALLALLAEGGVRRAAVRLHVGIGTFRPVESARLSEHNMHAERYELPEETVAAIAETRASGGRVVAVGTTVVRTLESHFGPSRGPLRGSTEILIRPGYRFAAVDALLTNFHQPRSTLLALVSAFAGYELIRSGYDLALSRNYRFLSYGDAMFIANRAEPA